jgi:hypothetical protein
MNGGAKVVRWRHYLWGREERWLELLPSENKEMEAASVLIQRCRAGAQDALVCAARVPCSG